MLLKFFIQQALLILTIVLLLLLIFPSWARVPFSISQSQGFQFGQVQLGGTGCPEGTYRLIRTDDRQMLTLLFDNFIAEVPQYLQVNDNAQMDLIQEGADEEELAPADLLASNPRLAHKVCNIWIGTNIPFGMKVKSIDFTFDYRGVVLLTAGARAVLASSLLTRKGLGATTSQRQILWKKRWAGRPLRPVDENWNLRQSFQVPINSRCSQRADQNFTIAIQNIMRTRLLPRADLGVAQGLLAMDSVDAQGVMHYQVQLAPCERH